VGRGRSCRDLWITENIGIFQTVSKMANNYVLTRLLALRFGVVGLLEFGVVGRVEFGVTDLFERDPERKSGNRYGETVRFSDL
jgi:hypothetical protein